MRWRRSSWALSWMLTLFVAGSKALQLIWHNFPRGSHELQFAFAGTFAARQRLYELLLGSWRVEHTRSLGLVHELQLLVGQAHKLAATHGHCMRRHTFWKNRLRTARLR